MHTSALQSAIEHVVDGSEACRQDMVSREEHAGIQESVLELSITIQELLTKEWCILHIFEEAKPQWVLE